MKDTDMEQAVGVISILLVALLEYAQEAYRGVESLKREKEGGSMQGF